MDTISQEVITIHYKGHVAQIEFDNDDRIFTGRLLGIDDIVTFHGGSVDELENAFHDSVDHYLYGRGNYQE